MQKIPICLFIIGLIILVATIFIGWIFIPNKIHDKIENTVKLENGTGTFEKWANISTPIFINFYIFNVTNQEEVKIGKKPKLQELGPYVYEQKRQKFDLSINERKDIISYRQRVGYFFRKDLSKGSEHDKITILNIPLVGISKRLAKIPGVVSYFANMYMTRFDQNVFFNTTVENFLFKGYYQALVDALQNTFGLKILPNSTFGLYYGKNNTDDGLYEIRSGRKDASEFGKIVSWKGQSNLTWWAGEYCNMINGTDGSIFPAFVDKERILRIFTPDLCRSIYMTFNQEVDFNGIPAYKFTIPQQMLEDPRINPENMCFCPNPGRKLEGCLRAGAIQLAACRKGAPIVASTPHFLDGYEGYIEQSGLDPVRSAHETFMEVEPNSGAVLRVSKKIQINVELSPISTLDILKKVPNMLFPIIWINEHATMTPESIQLLKEKLIKPLKIVKIGRMTLLGISLLVLAFAIALVAYVRRKKNRVKPDS